MGESLEDALEFADHHCVRYTQAGSRLEEHPTRHGSAGAFSLEFFNIDTALGQSTGEISDNPEMIIADQVEREPAGIWRRFICAAVCDHDLESMHCQPLQGVHECRSVGVGHTGAENPGELPSQLCHPTLQPLAVM